MEKCSKLSLMFTFPYIQAGCEVPLDPGIPAASIEHQLVVVETEEQLTGRDYCSRFFCFVVFFCWLRIGESNNFPLMQRCKYMIAVIGVLFIKPVCLF